VRVFVLIVLLYNGEVLLVDFMHLFLSKDFVRRERVEESSTWRDKECKIGKKNEKNREGT